MDNKLGSVIKDNEVMKGTLKHEVNITSAKMDRSVNKRILDIALQ